MGLSDLETRFALDLSAKLAIQTLVDVALT